MKIEGKVLYGSRRFGSLFDVPYTFIVDPDGKISALDINLSDELKADVYQDGRAHMEHTTEELEALWADLEVAARADLARQFRLGLVKLHEHEEPIISNQ